MTLYTLALSLHSLLRWLILAASLLVFLRAFVAWLQRRKWLPADERLHVALIGLADTQFLIGLIVYGLLSPVTRGFWSNTAVAMKDPILRFYGMEHAMGMIAAIAILHVGRARAKRAGATDAVRHRRVWTSVLVALVLIMLSIPWPNMPYGRPLLRAPW